MYDLNNLENARDRHTYVADPTANWEAGMVAVLTANPDDGSPMVTPATGASAETPVGLFWGDKTTARTIVEIEAIRFVDSSGAPTLTKQLKGTSIETASVRVTSLDGTTVYTVGGGSDYTVAANGVLTRVGGGTIPAGGRVLVRYRRDLLARELDQLGVDYNRGSDDTLGLPTKNVCTVLQGHHKVPVDQFHPEVAYTPGAALFVDSDARLTTQDTGSKKYGMVIEGPSQSYPFLRLEAVTPIV